MQPTNLQHQKALGYNLGCEPLESLLQFSKLLLPHSSFSDIHLSNGPTLNFMKPIYTHSWDPSGGKGCSPGQHWQIGNSISKHNYTIFNTTVKANKFCSHRKWRRPGDQDPARLCYTASIWRRNLCTLGNVGELCNWSGDRLEQVGIPLQLPSLKII